MRNIRRDRNRYFALLVGSTAAGVLMVLERPANGGFRWEDLGVAIAACAALLLLPAVISVALIHARYRRVKRGDHLIAQWTVTPAEWMQFMALEASRSNNFAANSIVVRPESVVSGVHVVIGAKGLVVDDNYEEFANTRIEQFHGPRWLDGVPASLEWQFDVVVEDGTSQWTVRIPIASGAERDATRVVEHFEALERARVA